MKNNKKDVNEYFKYLRLYYIQLLKKQKKENNKNKRKKINIENNDEDDDDINVLEKDTTNRKKIIRTAKLNKKKNVQGIETDNKETDKSKISKRIEDEIIKRNDIKKKKKKKEEEIEIIRRQQEKEFEELKLEQEKNIEEEKRKKEEENNKNLIYEDVREKLKSNGIDEKDIDNIELQDFDIDKIEEEINQIISDIEYYKNPRIGKQIAGNIVDNDKEEENEIDLPIVEEEIEEPTLEVEEEIIEEELEEPTLEEEVIEEELEEHTIEQDIEEITVDNENKDIDLENEVDIKNPNKPVGFDDSKDLEETVEEEIIEEEIEEPTLEEEIDEEEIELEEEIEEPTLEEEVIEEEVIEEEIEEPTLEEEIDEEEIIEEEKRRIGKEEFIDAINKKISEDYKSLHNLEMENHRLTQELENARDVGDVDKLLERIHNNQEEIDNIIGRINGIENGEIIKVAYSFSKTKPKELKEFIKELENEPKNYRYIDEFYKPHFKDKIDYIDRVNRLKNDTNAKEQEIQDKRETFSNLDNKRDDNDVELERYNKRRFYFENKLLKFQIALNTLQSKVQNITVEEKKITRFFLGNIEIKNSMQLRGIAMNIYNQPNNQREFQQIYQELQRKLTIVEESKLVPSANYRNMLLNEKNNIINTGLELKTTINEIRAMKEEFKEEFSDYYDNDEYFSYLEEIEKMERKFVSQTDKITMLNNKVDKTIIENDQKIAQIEQMNIGRDSFRIVHDPNNPQQQYQNGMNNYYDHQNPNYQGYNPYGNSEYEEEYEQERSRGRGR